MVIMCMGFVWNVTGFDLCFPGRGKPFPSSWLWFIEIWSTIPVGRIESVFFSLRLVSPEIGDPWVLSSLISWMGKSVSWHVQEPQYLGEGGIHQGGTRWQGLGVTFLERPVGNSVLLGSSTSASLEKPRWLFDLTCFADKVVLSWLCLVAMRVTLERTILCFSGCQTLVLIVVCMC